MAMRSFRIPRAPPDPGDCSKNMPPTHLVPDSIRHPTPHAAWGKAPPVAPHSTAPDIENHQRLETRPRTTNSTSLSPVLAGQTNRANRSTAPGKTDHAQTSAPPLRDPKSEPALLPARATLSHSFPRPLYT